MVHFLIFAGGIFAHKKLKNTIHCGRHFLSVLWVKFSPQKHKHWMWNQHLSADQFARFHILCLSAQRAPQSRASHSTNTILHTPLWHRVNEVFWSVCCAILRIMWNWRLQLAVLLNCGHKCKSKRGWSGCQCDCGSNILVIVRIELVSLSASWEISPFVLLNKKHTTVGQMVQCTQFCTNLIEQSFEFVEWFFLLCGLFCLETHLVPTLLQLSKLIQVFFESFKQVKDFSVADLSFVKPQWCFGFKNVLATPARQWVHPSVTPVDMAANLPVEPDVPRTTEVDASKGEGFSSWNAWHLQMANKFWLCQLQEQHEWQLQNSHATWWVHREQWLLWQWCHDCVCDGQIMQQWWFCQHWCSCVGDRRVFFSLSWRNQWWQTSWQQ